MKKFKCWYLNKTVGWVYFEKEFETEGQALKYCEEKTTFKGSSIVEEIQEN